MKLLTFEYEGKNQIGVLSKCGNNIYPMAYFGYEENCMNDFIEHTNKEDLKKIENVIMGNGCMCTTKCGAGGTKKLSLDSVRLLSPIPVPKQDIICLGINYSEHAEESARFKKEAFGGERPYAVYFSKRVNQAVAPGGKILSHEDMVDSLDYEVELAVVINKDCKNVSEEEAFDYVLGYTILNDVSARNVQTNHKQWYFGKSLDNFTPIGPWIVTEDEFCRPPILSISSKINGETRQDSSTGALIFGIAHVICELSKGMTLKAGTIIAMGTPAGVGMGFDPPKFMKKGDVVTCEIEGIGILENTVE